MCIGRIESATHAHATVDVLALIGDGRLDLRAHQGGKLQQCVRIRGALHNDRELVAAQTCHQRLVWQSCLQTTREHAQQMIACGVAQGVVDMFEVIQIDQHQAHRTPACVSRRQRMLEALVEAAPVGQAGQLITLAGKAQALLCTALRGHVTRDAQNAHDLALGVYHGGQNIVPMLGRLAGNHTHAGKARVLAFGGRQQRTLPLGANRVRQQGQPALPKTRIRRHAQSHAARAIHMGQGAIDVENLDAVDADIQHVFLHAQAAVQILLRHDALMHIHAADMPVRLVRGGIMMALRGQQCPAPGSAMVQQPVFALKAGPGAQRMLPELARVKSVVGVQAIQPVGVCVTGLGEVNPCLVAKYLLPALVSHPDQLRQRIQRVEHGLTRGNSRLTQSKGGQGIVAQDKQISSRASAGWKTHGETPSCKTLALQPAMRMLA